MGEKTVIQRTSTCNL